MRKIALLLIMALVAAFLFVGCKSAYKGSSETVSEKRTVTEGTIAGDGARTRPQLGEGDRGKAYEDYTESTTVAFNDIYFDFDKFSIREDAKSSLREVSSWISQKNAVIIIEGHCDERGTNEYNLGLGDRRANSTKQYLMASGVAPSKIDTVSYGEERPQCSDKNEQCWQRNRRAHFVVLIPK